MKAILEFDAPKSCVECLMFVLSEKVKRRECLAIGEQRHIHPGDLNIRRAPFCPLKLVPDRKEADNE